jgi:hypothetical protein
VDVQEMLPELTKDHGKKSSEGSATDQLNNALEAALGTKGAALAHSAAKK